MYFHQSSVRSLNRNAGAEQSSCLHMTAAGQLCPCLRMWTHSDRISVIRGDYSMRASCNSLYGFWLDEESRRSDPTLQYQVLNWRTTGGGLLHRSECLHIGTTHWMMLTFGIWGQNWACKIHNSEWEFASSTILTSVFSINRTVDH